jgi:hypothetical protein
MGYKEEFTIAGYGTFCVDNSDITLVRIYDTTTLFDGTASPDVVYLPRGFVNVDVAGDAYLYKVIIDKRVKGESYCILSAIDVYIKLTAYTIEIGEYDLTTDSFNKNSLYKCFKLNNSRGTISDTTRPYLNRNPNYDYVVVSSKGNEWGILDLQDNTIDFCTLDEISLFRELGLRIAGYTLKRCFTLTPEQLESYSVFYACLSYFAHKKRVCRDLKLKLSQSNSTILVSSILGGSKAILEFSPNGDIIFESNISKYKYNGNEAKGGVLFVSDVTEDLKKLQLL